MKDILKDYIFLVLKKDEAEFIIQALESYKIEAKNSYINQESKRIQKDIEKQLNK